MIEPFAQAGHAPPRRRDGGSSARSSPEWWRDAQDDPQPPDRYVAIDADKRYVRYTIRVNVTREQPYRLWPQVPRYWFAKDAIAKLDYFNNQKVELLARGVSDKGRWAKDAELAEDLERMRHQLEQDRWMRQKLAEHLLRLESIPPFSDIKT